MLRLCLLYTCITIIISLQLHAFPPPPPPGKLHYHYKVLHLGNLPDNKTFENLLLNTKQIITFITKSGYENINKHNYYAFKYNFNN